MTSSWHSEPDLDELDGHAAEDDVVGDGGVDGAGIGRQGGRGGHREQGPGPLPAGGDEVAAHLGHQLVLGRHRGHQGVLHPVPVPGHAGKAEERAVGHRHAR